MKAYFALLSAFASLVATAFAGEVEIVGVEIDHLREQSFRVSVTLRHDDEGWGHYADKWEVLNADGEKLGERVLAHPHVDEQPFTRSTTMTIPEGVEEVTIRARDSVHGWAEETVTKEVP
ncbi:hypothetical protein [Parvularcula maris]|uniref:Uncharacterized protein n=1 Tax=Parvularcula maris TaxID=2965077 RepID=A0A9X2RIS0_9PROT|nr:hypothetical protein [Parvularcula maris]MCQ8183873.1 hypothetical protein [Parvularcula maris]